MVAEKLKVDASIDYQIDLPYVEYLRHAILMREELKVMVKKSIIEVPGEEGKWLAQLYRTADDLHGKDAAEHLKKTKLYYRDQALPNSLIEDKLQGNTKFEDFSQLFRMEVTRIWTVLLDAEDRGRVVTMRDFYDIEKERKIYNAAAVLIENTDENVCENGNKNENVSGNVSENANKNSNERENSKENENMNASHDTPIVKLDSQSESESESKSESDKTSECEIRVFEPYLPYPLESVVAAARVVVYCKKEKDNELHRFEFQFEGCLSSDELEWRVKDIFYI
jgi:hypothetical protein